MNSIVYLYINLKYNLNWCDLKYTRLDSCKQSYLVQLLSQRYLYKRRIIFYTFPDMILAGSVTNAHMNFNTPSTAIPTNLNGSNNNHTSGYRINAIIATGQHITNKINHKRNLTIIKFPVSNSNI